MAQPPIKIKLRLSSQPQDSKVSTPDSSLSSSTPSSPKQAFKSESSPLEPPTKQSRSNKFRKPTTPQTVNTPTSNADTPNTAIIEDQGTPSSTPNRSQTQKSSSRIKAIFAHKDTPVRRWKKDPLVFYTMGGGKVEIPIGCWQSDEEMKLNKNTTEPTTMADVDQLFAMDKDFRPFLCTHPNCSKAFTSFDQLQTHETNMHGIKKMVCGIDHCLKSFATSGQLTKHRKMVHFRHNRKKRLEELKQQQEEEENKTENELPDQQQQQQRDQDQDQDQQQE
ncbi:unnamed protein product [Cunninghamella blakesleeana]